MTPMAMFNQQFIGTWEGRCKSKAHTLLKNHDTEHVAMMTMLIRLSNAGPKARQYSAKRESCDPAIDTV